MSESFLQIEKAMLMEVWAALGGRRSLVEKVTFASEGGLPSVYPVTVLASVSIAAAALAIAELLDRPALAMPDVAIEVVRSWFETWNRGDMDAFSELYAHDAQMTPPSSWVEAEILRGRPAIRRFFEGLKEPWEGRDEALIRDLFRAGEEIVSRMDWLVRGRTSGIETQIEVTNVNTIVGGRIVRQVHYLDHDEALRALGLAE